MMRRLLDQFTTFARTPERKASPIKPVDPDNLHLTLRFLGDIDSEAIPTLITALDRALQNSEPFDLCFTHLGAFPDVRRPRVIHVAVESNPPDALAALADQIDAQLLDPFGQRDRPFTAHLTLARIKAKPPTELFDWLATSTPASAQVEDRPRRTGLQRSASPDPLPKPIPSAPQPLSLHLIQSTLTPTGPVYDSLHAVEIGWKFKA